MTLNKASGANYYNKKIILKVQITGKALIPFQVPKVIKINCKPKKTCSKCIVVINKSNELTLNITDTQFIKFIGISDIHTRTQIADTFDIKMRCLFNFEILEVYTIEEVYLSDIISDKTKSFTSRIGYTIDNNIKCNTTYKISAYPVAEPRQQKVVFIITKTKPTQTDVESFKMTSEIHKKLKIFRPKKKSVEGIFNFLENLYYIYSRNITSIYERFDLHMAIDLVFHSPLQFYFKNEFVHKGYLDMMVLGDTRCGKGYVTENLVRYYKIGEIVSGENLTFAGLVGGVQQLSGRWVVTWGKLPLNHKRLVIIDESGEMDPKDLSKLSRIRSEGIAEITKIQTEKAPAMCRLIFLSNPRNRMVSSYTFGIEAIVDLIDTAEDIARFDYVLIVALQEVDINEINSIKSPVKNPYIEIDAQLVRWIWSRNKDQVKFTKRAIDKVYQIAIKFGNVFTPRIPLVQGENIRFKLARIAAAIAGRLYSSDPQGEILIIRECHVSAAAVFLNIIYKKKSSGYYMLSQLYNEFKEIHHIKVFEQYINSFETKEQLIDYFISNNYITIKDLLEHINQPREIGQEIISKLIQHKCIQKKYTFYVKNKCFTDWLNKNR